MVGITGRKDLYLIDADLALTEAVEAMLADIPTAGRTQSATGVRYLLTREDLHEAESLAAELTALGARVQTPVGSVSVVGSGLGEDRQTYRTILTHLSGFEGILTGTVWTAFMAPSQVDAVVMALHRDLLEG